MSEPTIGWRPAATRRLVWIGLLGTSLLFQVLSVRNVLFAQYGWTLSDPDSVRGGMVLLMAFVVMAMAATRPRLFAPAAAVVAAAYLCLNVTLAVAIASWVLIEAVLWIGQAARVGDAEAGGPTAATYGRDFIAGLAVWASAAFAVSLAGLGRPRDLIGLTVVLVLGATLRRPGRPLILWACSRSRFMSTAERVLMAFIGVVLMMQFAKTVHAIDYDSIWYGLRPQYVLYGAHSLFDRLGYTVWVYYYPKLFELLTLPVSALGDYAFISGVNVGLLALLACIVYALARQLSISRFSALLIAASIASIPAISNLASTAKPDILTTVLVVAGGMTLLQWIVAHNPYDLALGVAAVFLSLTAKLTSIAFVPPLLIGCALAWWFFGRSGRAPGPRFRVGVAIIPALAASVLGFSILRTLLLTGYPVVPILGRVWSALGFRLQYPFQEALAAGPFKIGFPEIGLARHWGRLLFAPKEVWQWVMVWPGNLAPFSLLAGASAWLASRRHGGQPRAQVVAALALAPVLATGVFFASTLHDGGDGNYLQIPLVLSITAALALALASAPWRRVVQVSVILFLPVQIAVTFVSHPSWRPGTGAFTLDMRRTLADERRRVTQAEYDHYGVASIARFLTERNTSRRRCIGYAASAEGPEVQALHKLPCGYEDVRQIAWGAPGLLAYPSALADYIGWADVRYVIVPNDSSGVPVVFRSMADALRRSPRVIPISDVRFTLFDLGESPGDTAARALGGTLPGRAP